MPKIKKPLSKEAEMTAKELRAVYGGMLGIPQIMQVLGVKSRHTADKWVEDIDAVIVNGRKRWMVSDVARKIELNRERAF